MTTQDHQCCDRDCQSPATRWIGKDGVENYTHSCDDHVNDLKMAGDVVVPIADAY